MTPAAFDLLLVYTSFRRHDQYLNICRHLGRKLRIGILRLDVDTSKVEKAETQFLAGCLDGGAVLASAPAHARALLVPRMGMGSIEKVEAWKRRGVTHEKLFILVCGPFSGIPFLPEIHRRIGPGVILTQDLPRFAAFEPETAEFLKTTPLEVVEVGAPFQRHPALHGFETDYLVAYPSHNSLARREHTYPLLDRMMQAIDSLPADARVSVKPHNVKDAGNYISYRSPSLQRLRLPLALLRLPLLAARAIAYLEIGGRAVYTRLPQRLCDMLRHLQNEYIYGRCENVLDKFPGFGMEHFVSGVRRGVITGLSTVLWETLYQRKPVLNVDRLPLDGRIPNFQILARSYGAPEWDGFDTRGFATISDSCREKDLLAFLERSCREASTA